MNDIPDGFRGEDPMEHRDAELIAAIPLLSKAAVLVVGDAMLDRYIYGTVSRLSQEAPIPVLAIDREVSLPGGAGNVVRNLTALGASAAFISVIGDDAAGSDLTTLIGRQQNIEPWLLVEGRRITTIKTRFIARGQQLLRSDREETGPVHPKLAERLVRIARDAIGATTVTVLSDYGKGVLSGEVPAVLVEAARKADRTVIVDPRGSDFSRYAGADIVMPNRPELSAATGMPIDTEGAIVAAARVLRERHHFGAVVITRGNDGMTLVTENLVQHFPAEAIEVYDTSGSGDTALATLAAAIAVRLPLPVAVRLANLAAGVVVGKVGSAVAGKADLLAALSPRRSASRKTVTREEAIENVARWRHGGLRIGFAHGPFDPPDAAHIQLLKDARARCDRLVVGLSGHDGAEDGQTPSPLVRRDAADAATLAGMACVDLICHFASETPEPLIQALRPDLLIVSGDGGIEPAAAADMVRGWGGEALELRAQGEDATPVPAGI